MIANWCVGSTVCLVLEAASMDHCCLGSICVKPPCSHTAQFQACFCCPAGPFLHSGRDIGEQDVLLSLQLPKSFASSLGCQQYGCQNTRAYGAVAGHGNIVVLIGNAGVLSRLPITCTFSQSNLTRPDSQSSERLELLTPFA